MNTEKTQELREQIEFAERQCANAVDEAQRVYHARMKRIVKKFLQPGTKISFRRILDGPCAGIVLEHMPSDFVRQDVVTVRLAGGLQRWVNVAKIKEVK